MIKYPQIIFTFLVLAVGVGLTFYKKSKVLPHIVVECSVFDLKGLLLWTFPNGGECLFFDDGRFVNGSKTGVRMYDSHFKLMWERSDRSHHQLNFGLNRKTILVISEEFQSYRDKMVRFDRFLVLNLNGEITKEFSFFKKRKVLNKIKNIEKQGLWKYEVSSKGVKVSLIEYSHGNSFYEIPENASSGRNRSFKKSNYIINVNLQFITAILDSSLDKILWTLPHDVPDSRENNTHDVQVQKNGLVLIYANRGDRDRFSTIDEFDPIRKVVKTIYRAKSPDIFFSERCGGVQRLDGNRILVNDFSNGPQIHEIDLDNGGKRVWSMKYIYVNAKRTSCFLQAKKHDLTRFLSANKGL